MNRDRICWPDYDRSIVNIMASLLNYYGLEASYPTLAVLDQALSKKPKHVMLLVFDGMGALNMEDHLPEDACLRRRMVDRLTSVFPPTTTAAMTAYYTGMSPGAHGWLGWSLYFKEYGASVDLFTNDHTHTGKPMETKKIAYRSLPYRTVYDRIYEAQGTNVDIHTVKIETIPYPSGPNRHHPVRDMDHMTKVLKAISSGETSSFTSAYWEEPDHVMHTYGPGGEETHKCLQEINAYVTSLSKELKDTLLIVSADHGQVAINSYIYLNDDTDLNPMLLMPPTVEPRCLSLFVNKGQHEAFRRIFMDRYGDDFILLSHEEVLEKELFGREACHHRFDDFIGDFIAVGISDKLMLYRTDNNKGVKSHKGHHAGLVAGEMTIPLILIQCGGKP